jgi:hypothetical protein
MEDQFQRQENLRIEAESKKNRAKLGLPSSETVETQLPDDNKQIQVTINNSSVRNFLKTTHEEFQQILAHQQTEAENKQSEALKLFESELQTVSDKLSELIDNFNLYVAQERTERKAHRERVQKTCDLIDREITL